MSVRVGELVSWCNGLETIRRSGAVVIPSERSESRDLHLLLLF